MSSFGNRDLGHVDHSRRGRKQPLEAIPIGALHASTSTAEGARREADDCVPDPQARDEPVRRRRVLPIEGCDQLEEQPDVGDLGRGTRDQVQDLDAAGLADELEKGGDRPQHAQVDVGCRDPGVGGQAHPRQRERIESAAEIQHRLRLAGDGPDGRIEIVEDRDAFARRGMGTEDAHAGGTEAGIGQLAAPRRGHARIGDGSSERPDSLVEPPLHALHRLIRRPGRGQLLVHQPTEERRIDVTVPGRFEHAVHDLARHRPRAASTRAYASRFDSP